MSFVTDDMSLELVRVLAPIVPAINKHDRDLADQMKRAATSVVVVLLSMKAGGEAAAISGARSRSPAMLWN